MDAYKVAEEIFVTGLRWITWGLQWVVGAWFAWKWLWWVGGSVYAQKFGDMTQLLEVSEIAVIVWVADYLLNDLTKEAGRVGTDGGQDVIFGFDTKEQAGRG